MLADNPLPSIAPDVAPHAPSANDATLLAAAALDKLNAALASKDVSAVEACFFLSQSYWKDNLALTYHLRTISTAVRIADSLVETAELRQMGPLRPEGTAQFNPVFVSILVPVQNGLDFLTSLEVHRLWLDIHDGIARRHRKWKSHAPPC